MQEEERLVEELNKIIHKPGGKQAARFVLSALGAIPFVGGAIAGVGGVWGEKEQQHFNEKIVEWAAKTDSDLGKILVLLSDQLREPTKAHMALLIGEIAGVDIDNKSISTISMILNGETVNELKPYIDRGWMSLKPNGNVTNMGAGNRIGNSIEDKKRPWGMGNGFVLTVSPKYFSEETG